MKEERQMKKRKRSYVRRAMLMPPVQTAGQTAREIPSAFSALDTQIDALDKLIDELGNKLQPVTTIAPSPSGASPIPAPPYNCGVANRMDGIRDRLVNLTNRVRFLSENNQL